MILLTPEEIDLIVNALNNYMDKEYPTQYEQLKKIELYLESKLPQKNSIHALKQESK